MMRRWHEYAETFPLIEGNDFEKMVASVKRTKGNKDKPCLYRVRQGEQEGLDGRNRERACKQARVKCFWKKVTVADDDVEEFIDRHNDVRRHMTPEQREARVLLLRSQGRSTREIAEKVDTSRSTVQRTLDRLGDTAPEGQVVGTDGRRQKADRPGDAAESEILCSRCARIGQETPAPSKGGCSKCQAARAKDAKRAEKRGARVGAQRNGQAAFDQRPYRTAKGELSRQVDKLARLYGDKDSTDVERLQKHLAEFDEKFVAYWTKLRERSRKLQPA